MGDARHQKTKSDHNMGNAFDVTNDPKSGCAGDYIAACAIRDPRVKYIIFNHRIWNKQRGDKAWRPYHGVNAHEHHCHVSILAGSRNDTRPWEWAPGGKNLAAMTSGATHEAEHAAGHAPEPQPTVTKKPATTTTKKDAPGPIDRRAFPGVTLQRGMRGDLVQIVQERLKKLRWDVQPDSLFGEDTERIVRAFQKRHDLHVDGVIGRRTWNALFSG
jgi:hypothetical protein